MYEKLSYQIFKKIDFELHNNKKIYPFLNFDLENSFKSIFGSLTNISFINQKSINNRSFFEHKSEENLFKK